MRTASYDMIFVLAAALVLACWGVLVRSSDLPLAFAEPPQGLQSLTTSANAVYQAQSDWRQEERE